MVATVKPLSMTYVSQTYSLFSCRCRRPFFHDQKMRHDDANDTFELSLDSYRSSGKRGNWLTNKVFGKKSLCLVYGEMSYLAVVFQMRMSKLANYNFLSAVITYTAYNTKLT